jgi:hypothetical protein
MKFNPRYPAVFVSIFLLAVCGTLRAEETDTVKTKKPFHPKYYFYFGAYSPNISTTFILDGKNLPGTLFSLENDAGLDQKPWLFRFDAMGQFTKRSGVTVSFVNVSRGHTWVIDRDVRIRDSTYHVGASLNIYFNTQFYSASYNYFIFSRPEWKAGVSIGVRFLLVKAGVTAETTNHSDHAEGVVIPAPAPVIGLYGTGYMTKRLQFKYNLDYFNISVKGVSAGVLDNRVSLEYYIIKNVGLGGAINYLYYRVREIPIGENFDGEFKYTLNGFNLYAAFRF